MIPMTIDHHGHGQCTPMVVTSVVIPKVTSLVTSSCGCQGWLYLWDWGPGSGVNWFISNNVTSNFRGIESHLTWSSLRTSVPSKSM